mgnify:CR=1 FL=1
MFLDWKNQYCQNDSTTQGKLHIQGNPYHITNGILHRMRTKTLFFLICMETQRPQIAKGIFFFFFLFRATPVAYGSSQARGQIGAIDAGLHHSSQQCKILNPVS